MCIRTTVSKGVLLLVRQSIGNINLIIVPGSLAEQRPAAMLAAFGVPGEISSASNFR